MYTLPVSIEIEGKEYAIRNKGDFRMVLDCFKALNDIELNPQERIFAALIIFYEGFENVSDIDGLPDIEQAVLKMYDFFNCGQPDTPSRHSYKLIDWEQDSMLVCSAVNTVAQKEIRLESYIHWWTFIAYYMAIGECALSAIISIRYKIATNKKLDDHEKKFRRENPQYFIWNARTAAQQDADDWLRSVWNKE